MYVHMYNFKAFIIIHVAPCQPFPCVNNGICYTVYINDQYCDCPDSFYGRFCESTQKVSSYVSVHKYVHVQYVCMYICMCVRCEYNMYMFPLFL